MDRKQQHFNALEEALKELLPLSKVTAAPASKQYQYVGTHVENTLVLLISVLNSLDNGGRHLEFSDFENWVSAMQAVHRSFYSSIIIAVEMGLHQFCEQENIIVEVDRQRSVQSIIGKIEKEKGELTPKIKKLIRQLAGERPGFMDYVKVVTRARIDLSMQNTWEKFFEALTIIRNKSAHSDTSLSVHDRAVLNDGGLGVLVSSSGELQANARNYKQIIDLVLRFYDEVQGSSSAA